MDMTPDGMADDLNAVEIGFRGSSYPCVRYAIHAPDPRLAGALPRFGLVPPGASLLEAEHRRGKTA